MAHTLTRRQMVLKKELVRHRFDPGLVEDSVGLEFLVVGIYPAIAVFVS